MHIGMKASATLGISACPYLKSEAMHIRPLKLLHQEGVRTLSVRMGVPRIFWTCIALLELAYAGALCVGFASQVGGSPPHDT